MNGLHPRPNPARMTAYIDRERIGAPSCCKEDVSMASQIPVSSIIADFRLMLSEHWAYRIGGAQRNDVDCSGAFVWAYRQHGISIYHGSNRMARVEVVSLIPINMANIVPGMAAFKHRKPGEAGYDLPAGYKPGAEYYNGDLNDYYHIGLVDTDTSRVLNAQSTATGFVSSPITQGWSHVALLRQVDYGANNPVPEQPDAPTPGQPDIPSSGTAVVYAANGLPVKLRRTASTKLPYLTEVPVGATVTLRGQSSDGWTPISYNGQNGYMMSEFLTAGSDTGDSYAVTLSGLTYAQAKELEAAYPNNRPTITQTGS